MFTFDNTQAHRFQPGMIYLGRDPVLGFDVGMFTEKGAITCADARTGKGAAQIIPNVQRWHGNLLTIDPTAEIIEATWDDLERRGYEVCLLDPMQRARVPARLRGSCNLLAGLDPKSLTIREDIRLIADGIIMRHDPKHGSWDNAKMALIAGLIAHVVSVAPPEARTLCDVAKLLNKSEFTAGDDELAPLEVLFRWMTENPACAGLAQRGGQIGLASLRSKGGEGPTASAIEAARGELDWVSARGMQNILGSSTFDLAGLKTGKVAVFLVLPERFLIDHARFLRLFVTCAITAMQVGGKVRELNPNGYLNRPCLFMLDEFPALGNLGCIKAAAGALPKYGVHLWPFVQGPHQLDEIYGENGARTFFNNADAHCFFGAADHKTMKIISDRIGALEPAEIAAAFEPLPPVTRRREPNRAEQASGAESHGRSIAVEREREILRLQQEAEIAQVKENGKPRWWESSLNKHSRRTLTRDRVRALQDWHITQMGYLHESEADIQKKLAFEDDRAALEHAHADALRKAEYEHLMRNVGLPRLTPREVAGIIGKGDGDQVARSMIVFGKAGAVFNLELGAYFDNASTIGTVARRSLTSSNV